MFCSKFEPLQDSAVLEQCVMGHMQNVVTSHSVTSLSPPPVSEEVSSEYGGMQGSLHMLMPVQVASPASQQQEQHDMDLTYEIMDVKTLVELQGNTSLTQHPTNVSHELQQSTSCLPVSELQHLNQQNNQLMIISRDESGEIDIQKGENITLEKSEEKMLKKIAKTASVRPLKADKDAAYASMDQEILQYMVRYEGEEAIKKITMRDLRHVIPLLIMRCFSISEEPYQRKVRGMWTEKPSGWPSHVPYCDPNNKKTTGKPKKSTLLQMFVYLKDHYTTNYGDVIVQYKARRPAHAQCRLLATPSPVSLTALALNPAVASPNLVNMESVTPITDAGVPFSSPPTALAVQHPISAALTTVPPSPPPPPTAIIAEQNWDPESEIMERIRMKLLWALTIQIARVDSDMLNNINGVLHKLFQVRSQDHGFFLDIAHEFEASLDTLRMTGKIPEKSRVHLCKFFERYTFPEAVESEEVADITCEPLGVGREEEVTTTPSIMCLEDASTTPTDTPAHFFRTISIEPNAIIANPVDLHGNNENVSEVLWSQCNNNEEIISELNPDDFGKLLKTSLQLAEPYSANIHHQPLAQLQPSGTSFTPSDTDLHHLSGLAFTFNTILAPDQVPSTTVLLTGGATAQPSADYTSCITMDIDKLRIRKDMQDSEKVKTMAQAFFDFNKKPPSPSSIPPQVLPTACNPIIPVVVEDMERADSDSDNQPDVKRRCLQKRLKPSPCSTDVTRQPARNTYGTSSHKRPSSMLTQVTL